MIFSYKNIDGSIDSGSYTITPFFYNFPSGSTIITGDPVKNAVVSTIYKVKSNDFAASHDIWYISGSNTTASNNLLAGFQITGSMCATTFDFGDCDGNKLTASVVITPLYKEAAFSGSFIRSTPLTFKASDFSSSIFTVNLVPYPYMVSFYSNQSQPSFIISPTGTSCNASDVIVVEVDISTNIASASYDPLVYTAMVSDLRYAPFGSVGASLVSGSTYNITASVATTANTLNPLYGYQVSDLEALNGILANSISIAADAFIVDTTGTVHSTAPITSSAFKGDGSQLTNIVALSSPSASWASSSLSASIANTASFAKTAALLNNANASIDINGNVSVNGLFQSGGGTTVIDAVGDLSTANISADSINATNYSGNGSGLTHISASYVTASNVVGTIANVLSASYSNTASVLLNSSASIGLGGNFKGASVNAGYLNTTLVNGVFTGSGTISSSNWAGATTVTGTGTHFTTELKVGNGGFIKATPTSTGNYTILAIGSDTIMLVSDTFNNSNFNNTAFIYNGNVNQDNYSLAANTSSINFKLPVTSSVPISATFFVGNGSQLTNVVAVSAASASWASSSLSSSISTTALTASYITASNVIGMVQSSSFANTALTASYITSSKISGAILNASQSLTTLTLANNNAYVDLSGNAQFLTVSTINSFFTADAAGNTAVNALTVATGGVVMAGIDDTGYLYADSAQFGLGTCNILNSGDVTATSFNGDGTNVTGIVSASFAKTASYITSSKVVGTVTSASYSQTASFALNGSSGTTLVTASTYPITSSWSNFSQTASLLSMPADNNNYTLVMTAGQVAGNYPLGLSGVNFNPNSQQIIATNITAALVQATNLIGNGSGVTNIATASYANTAGYVTASLINVNNVVSPLLTLNVASCSIDFNYSYVQCNTTGSINFSSSFNGGAVKAATVYLPPTSSLRNVSFNPSWVFVGVQPSTLAANKSAVLSLTSFGAAENNVIAAFAAQS